jgi:hypothetical protein
VLTTRHAVLDGSGDALIGTQPCRLAGITCAGSFTVDSLGRQVAADSDYQFFNKNEAPVVANLAISGDPGAQAVAYLELYA